MNLTKKNNILILSYFFPPCNKVGGRRWAKFGKYLTKDGYNISVVCVNTPFNGECPWNNDINDYKDQITRLPYFEHRPYYRVNKAPKSFLGKVRYHLSLYKEKISHGKTPVLDGNISIRYKKLLYEKAKKIILDKKIDTVIITGGPFDWCYFGIQLKKEFHQLNFLIDLRDFWTGGEDYSKFNINQQKLEDIKELECIKNADHISTPAQRIDDFLKLKYPNFSDKFFNLPHAFDADEIIEIEHQLIGNPDLITFAYGGILYANMESVVLRLIDFLKKLIESGKQIQLDLYTFNKSYSHLFFDAELQNYVTYYEPVPAIQLFSIFKKTDYLLQLRAGEGMEQHFKSTKFYELIALRKPIIYFGPEGDVSEFIKENQLGFSGNQPLDELCNEVINNKKTETIPDKLFNISGFEYKNVTSFLESFL